MKKLHGITAIATLMAGGATGSPAVRSGDDLIGLWGAEPLIGPQIRGDIVIERRGAHWTARVAGFETVAERSGDSVVLKLAGGQGAARLSLRGAAVEGFWVQPGSDDSPAYATPIRLHAAGANAWRGTVTPLEQRFPLYLSVSRAADGSLRGIFRNPEVNWPGRAGAYVVKREGDDVTFTDGRTGQIRYRQPYDSSARTITFDFGGLIRMTPRTQDQAIGFLPRSRSLPAYEYRAPVVRADGWRTARAKSLGVDETALRDIVRSLVNADPLSDSAPRVHSLLVARRGQLVLEEYFYGYHAGQRHDLRSASKTMTSIMAGVAMQHGARFDMSSRVDGMDGARSAITVGQLLTHTSGLACDDDDEKSPGNEDAMQSQRAQPDWYRYTMSLPVAHAPGTVYAYCSGGINLVGHVIGQSVHEWLPAFFDRTIARPLQMGEYAINLMPTGEAYGGGGMHMLPRDLLKFGTLYLDGGVWNGARLVSADWVKQSTAHQVSRPDGSDDGFGWHRHVLRVGTKSFQTYEASGNGGQFLIVIPELQLTAVVTAGNYGQYGVWKGIREVLIPEVMAALRNG